MTCGETQETQSRKFWRLGLKKAKNRYVMNKRKISENRVVMKKVPCTAGTHYSAQTISSYSTRETCSQKLSALDSWVVTSINTYEC